MSRLLRTNAKEINIANTVAKRPAGSVCRGPQDTLVYAVGSTPPPTSSNGSPEISQPVNVTLII